MSLLLLASIPVCIYSLHNISAFLITFLSLLQCDHLPPNKCSRSRTVVQVRNDAAWQRLTEALATLYGDAVSLLKVFWGSRTIFFLTLSVWLASVPQSAIFPTAQLKLPHCTLMQLGSPTPNPCYVNLSPLDFIFLDHLACEDLFRYRQSSKIRF